METLNELQNRLDRATAIVQENAGAPNEIKRLLKREGLTYTVVQKNITVNYIVRGKGIIGKHTVTL
jgi:hypothetical protein